MRKVVSLGLVMIMFVMCSGCIWWHEREGHEREGYGEHERGGHGEHERGWHGEGDRY